MKNHWTGCVLDEKIELGWFGRVHIYHLETYKIGDMLSSEWHKVNTLKFKNKAQAKDFINKYIKRNNHGK